MLESLSSMQPLRAALAQVPEPVWLGVYIVWLALAAGYLVVQRRNAEATLAWVLAAAFLPFIGALVYVVFGPHRLVRKRFRRSAAKGLARELVPTSDADVPRELAGQRWLATLAQVAIQAENGRPRRAESVRVFVNGDDTYAAVEAAIHAAQLQIHMEYYIWAADAVGMRWRDLLARQAQRGITVRVLVDAMGSKSAGPAFWAPLVAAGGEVRYFNPVRLFLLQPSLINFRTHRKIVVIDGRVAYTGGVNVTAGTSAQSSGSAAWRDTHLEITGPAALDLQVVFLEDWLYASLSRREQTREIDTRIDVAEWFPAPMLEAAAEATRASAGTIRPWVQIVDSGPDEPQADIHRFMFTAITSARHRVWITTPYFVPDDAMVTALTTALARGVDVRILLPHRGDSLLVTAAAYSYAQDVAQAGVAVFEYMPRMVHAKTMVVDDELSLIGTANFDNRSFRLNFEVLAAIYDRDVAAQMACTFETDLRDARPLPGRGERERMPQRLLSGIARLASPVL